MRAYLYVRVRSNVYVWAGSNDDWSTGLLLDRSKLEDCAFVSDFVFPCPPPPLTGYSDFYGSQRCSDTRREGFWSW